MTRAEAERTLARLHEEQGAFYAGGPREPLHDVLTEDIVWVVPGRNAIAGEYRGRDAVIDYFTRRRELADRSFRMDPGDVLVGDGDHVAVLTDGTATIDGVEHRWSTVGLYRLREGASRRAGCCRSTRRLRCDLVRVSAGVDGAARRLTASPRGSEPGARPGAVVLGGGGYPGLS